MDWKGKLAAYQNGPGAWREDWSPVPRDQPRPAPFRHSGMPSAEEPSKPKPAPAKPKPKPKPKPAPPKAKPTPKKKLPAFKKATRKHFAKKKVGEPIKRCVSMDKESMGKPVRKPYADAEAEKRTDVIGGKARVEAGVIKMDQEGKAGWFGGSHKLDVFHGEAEAEGGVGGVIGGAEARAEVQMVKESVRGFVGPDANNPLSEARGEYRLLNAHAEASQLLGDDGRRVGIAGKMDLDASLAHGELDGEVNIPIPFTEYSLSVRGGVEGSVGPSLGAGAHGYYDKEEERVHVGVRGKVIAGGKLDISFGKKYKDRERKKTGP